MPGASLWLVTLRQCPTRSIRARGECLVGLESGPPCPTSTVHVTAAHVTAAERATKSVAEVLRCDNVFVAPTPATIRSTRQGLLISERSRILGRNDPQVR